MRRATGFAGALRGGVFICICSKHWVGHWGQRVGAIAIPIGVPIGVAIGVAIGFVPSFRRIRAAFGRKFSLSDHPARDDRSGVVAAKDLPRFKLIQERAHLPCICVTHAGYMLCLTHRAARRRQDQMARRFRHRHDAEHAHPEALSGERAHRQSRVGEPVLPKEFAPGETGHVRRRDASRVAGRQKAQRARQRCPAGAWSYCRGHDDAHRQPLSSRAPRQPTIARPYAI